ncbi:MAG: hypothetical protein P8Y12_01360 [Gammaproteobacteria bacterium]
MKPKQPIQECELCLQDRDLSFHHLIPRKLHRRSHFKKKYSKADLSQGIFICSLCHRGLHKLYDEMTLGKHFLNRESILGDPSLAKHIAWSARQKIKKGKNN